MYPHYIPSILPLHPQYIYSFSPECPIQPPCWLLESQGYILIYAMVTTWNHVPILVQCMVIIYIYPYLMVRSLSHYIKWYPHMISYFVYTVWIYIYIHINIYIHIYIYIWWVIYLYHGELWHYYGYLSMAFYGGLNLVRAEVPGSPPSRPPGKRPVSNCRRCHGGKKVMERWEWWLMVVNSV